MAARANSVHELSAALARAAGDVALLATGSGLGLRTRGEGRLRVEVFPREWPLRLCASSGLRARLDRPEADIVQHHSLWLRTLHYAHRGAVRGRARRLPARDDERLGLVAS